MTDDQFKLKDEFNNTLLFYLDVENKSEFIEKQKHLNDKTLNDLNGTQTQFDFFSFTSLALLFFEYTAIEEDSYNVKYNHSLSALQLLSPFGKCFTYLWKTEENRKMKFDTDHLIRIIENKDFMTEEIRIKYLTKRLFIHSSDELPDSTTYEVQVTDISYYQQSDFTLFIERTDFKKTPQTL